MSELFENAIVEKRNVLNELRANNLTLQELRFFSIYLSKINPYDKSTRIVRFPLSEFQKIMDFGKLNIKQLKASTDSLLGKKVHIPLESGGYKAFVLFSSCTVDKNISEEWYIEISASQEALPLMFDFKNRYFKYELWNALRLTSTNQIRMYEILKQYERIGVRELLVTDLRELLGILPEEYPRWENFKVRVLDSCQKSLKEKSDICYTYSKGKSGRGGKWISVIFRIYKNTSYNSQISLFEKSLAEFIDLDKMKNEQTPENINVPEPAEPHEHSESLLIDEDTRFSETLQNMISIASHLQIEQVMQIHAYMQEKGYSDIFLSFKRIYTTACSRVNNKKGLFGYIMTIIKNESAGQQF